MFLKKIIFSVIIVLLLIFGAFFVIKNNLANDSVVNLNENKNNKLDDLIEVYQPQAQTTISSPLTFSGQARGNWFFEASFPVILVNWDGAIIGQGLAQAESDWMTEDYVKFSGSLTFIKPKYGKNGAIIFKKDNPSGLPQYDNALEIPILFE